jgi:hypothetical protein
MSKNDTCPWCGHDEYHKENSCDDTCCEGCPGVDNQDCDCQKTTGEIAFRNGGGWCYAVLDKPDVCAEHKAPFPILAKKGFFGEQHFDVRCEKWQDGPAAWRFKDGALVYIA